MCATPARYVSPRSQSRGVCSTLYNDRIRHSTSMPTALRSISPMLLHSRHMYKSTSLLSQHDPRTAFPLGRAARGAHRASSARREDRTGKFMRTRCRRRRPERMHAGHHASCAFPSSSHAACASRLAAATWQTRRMRPDWTACRIRASLAIGSLRHMRSALPKASATSLPEASTASSVCVVGRCRGVSHMAIGGSQMAFRRQPGDSWMTTLGILTCTASASFARSLTASAARAFSFSFAALLGN